jgi:hypothetical protein
MCHYGSPQVLTVCAQGLMLEFVKFMIFHPNFSSVLQVLEFELLEYFEVQICQLYP